LIRDLIFVIAGLKGDGYLAKTSEARGLSAISGFPTFVLVVVILYLGRDVCIPIALAVLLSFMLGPVVSRLQGLGLHRVPAVLAVMTLALALAVAGAWLVADQLIGLADGLPQYQTMVHNKLKAFHTRPGSLMDRLNQTLENYSGELESIAEEPTSRATGTQATSPQTVQEKPVEVHLAKSKTSNLELLEALVVRAIGPVASAGIVIILTLFMLIQWQDVRDRAIRLIGAGQLRVTTTAMDEASHRVGRYLLMQLTVNSLFGLCCGIGLYFIGVPYCVLWGALAACLRFIPYFGAPIAAVFPLTMAFATMPGFKGVWLTVALYAGLEITIGNLIEPCLYGSSTGISPLAIIASALFWTFLWGPLGLLLSTPLTVCLVVVGKHVPKLSFLNIIFGDEPVLAPEARFYQRLLAADQEDAADMAEEKLKSSSLVELYDTLMIPALVLAEQDRHRGDLDEAQENFIFQSIRDLVEDMAERPDRADAETSEKDAAAPMDGKELNVKESPAEAATVLCIPAKDEADELAALMLAGLLKRQGFKVELISSQRLTGEAVHIVEELKPCLICVSAVPPLALLHARYMCMRLRSQYPDLKLVVGIWQSKADGEKLKTKLPASLVEYAAITLADAVTRITAIANSESTRSSIPVEKK
jgi:predicted PurR-regulated permease PerM